MLRPGYTLIELLVVIAILALAAGLAVPASSQVIASVTLRSDATLITGILRGLQDEAVRTQTAVTVMSSSGPLRTSTGRTLYSSSSLSVEVSEPITFYPDGTTDGGTLHLGDQSRHLIITVAWLTGDVRVGEP